MAATRNTPVYLFILPTLASSLLPSPLPSNLILDTTITDGWQHPPVARLEQRFKDMHRLDREKKIHSPELYAIWNAKPWLTEEGMRKSRSGEKFEWDYVFWADAGSFRDTWYNGGSWPLPKIRRTWEKVGEDEMDTEHKVFLPLQHATTKELELEGGLRRSYRRGNSEASFFGGSPSTIRWFNSTFDAYRNFYMSRSFFIGKEQPLLNSLILLLPSRFIRVHVNDPYAPAYIHPNSMLDHRWLRSIMRRYLRSFYETRALGRCRGEYMYYQFFFADKHTRQRLQDMWLSDLHDSWDHWFGGGENPGGSEKCRTTRAISLLEAFRKDDVLGPNWDPATYRSIVVRLGGIR
ncbi:hypothetical protein E1B28_002998 [Marasmius oreades]|uniref:Glycosyl transferase CAP10 domain-containing protein n=1 Tax=Marasmius oreades TaxID=181124 RepID=A0A9P7RKR2_9AGAR|nr:uncharacterized protein E1B28_002998 [Marasmius oreades]KAG7085437.1 hypothetical protein E1B28_002998 [Marasmius oreades]